MDVQGLYVWVLVLISMLSSFKVQSYFVNITYVESAVAKGAVCLDGSPPAYHFSPGFGSGVNNWLVHFEGGGWCNNVTTCLKRRDTRLGSSKFMKKQVAFSGIFSNKACYNPAFYDWNKVKVRYCDGSSFTGDIEEVDPATNLHYRGARIFLAVIEDLKEKGLAKATNALLSGCSAGGLTTILHCDEFHALLPTTTKVKCLSDAGYFIDIKDLSGVQRIKNFYNDVIQTHGSAKNLDPSCISEMDIASMCFFPQYIARRIQTPLFILNAAYDSWQIKNILVPGAADPHGTWHDCKNNIKLCSSAQLDAIQYFRLEFLNALSGSILPTSRGFYINSCYAHCQSEVQETWLAPDSPLLGSASISEAVRDWYYDYNPFRMIDCPYPCDSTCHNRVFEASSGLQQVKDRYLLDL